MGPDEEKVAGSEVTSDSPVTVVAGGDDGNKTLVKTRWPVGQFVVENIPVITTEGVELDADQLAEVQKMAELCEVKLDVVEGA